MPEGSDDDGDDGEWRFSIDEVGDGEGVAGPFGPAETIEPQAIDRENALFVGLGVVLGIVLLVLLLP